MEDVYQMSPLPGTGHEMGHFWENPCHENNVKFLPLWLLVAALWIPLGQFTNKSHESVQGTWSSNCKVISALQK